MRRFNVPAVLVLLFVLTGTTLALGQAIVGGATASPDHVTLTWTGNPATTMTVTWRTDTTVTEGFVEYEKGAALSTGAQQLRACASDFTTDSQATRLFTATLTSLSPNTTYSYRVGNGEYWSDAFSFTTVNPAASTFKFLVFGDSQSSMAGNPPYGLWGKTVHNAHRANLDARFMINVGDLVDAGQHSPHWNAWFTAAAGVIDRIPEMPVVGNHETSGSSDTRCPTYYNAQFNLPRNAPAELKNQAYSFDYGPAHIVVLDSQPCGKNQLQLQSKWLDTDLAASTAAWKIVFFHKGAYSLLPERDNKSVRDAFCPVMDKYHVDLVFNAHDHGIGRTYPIKGGKYMTKPSEGTIYYTAGRSGEKYYTSVAKQEWNTFCQCPEDQPNYFVVDVNDSKLTVKTVKMDGTLIDNFYIDKKKDASSDSVRLAK